MSKILLFKPSNGLNSLNRSRKISTLLYKPSPPLPPLQFSPSQSLPIFSPGPHTLLHFSSISNPRRNFPIRAIESSPVKEGEDGALPSSPIPSPDSKKDRDEGDYPSGEFEMMEFDWWRRFLVKLRMLFALPWERVKKGSVLSIKLRGQISDQLKSRFTSGLSLPQICENFTKAAYDPRISGIYLQIEPLSCGWGKVDEIRRHILDFKKSGKFIISFIPVCGEKEYYLACACGEVYVPPSAYVALYGLAVQSSFLGGVLEKVGVEPQIQRIGKYKSAGDQLARKSMSKEICEMLTSLLDNIYGNWLDTISSTRGKRREEIEDFLDTGVYQVERLKEEGWITNILYDDEDECDSWDNIAKLIEMADSIWSVLIFHLNQHLLREAEGVAFQCEEEADSHMNRRTELLKVFSMLKERLGQKNRKNLLMVDYRKYSRVRNWTLGLEGGGDQIAIIRASGSITRTRSLLSVPSSGIIGEQLIEKIRSIRESERYKAVILRIDSPGGDALASDLMWREIRLLAASKPVIASMSDVAASGGYYMAMAADTIVAEKLTLTGSIGVVTGKFSLSKLYERIGFNKEIISRGKYAELFAAEQRPFRPDEAELFEKSAQNAYRQFRDKAAFSRSMTVDQMEEVAQGRVWSGKDAASRGLVDAIGGFSRAVAIARHKAKIPRDRPVRLVEVSKPSPSIPEILTGIGSSLVGLDRTVKELLQDLTSSNAVQARMDGILFERLENASDGNPIFQLIRDYLSSF